MGVPNPSQTNVQQMAKYLKTQGIQGVAATGNANLDALFKMMGLSKWS